MNSSRIDFLPDAIVVGDPNAETALFLHGYSQSPRSLLGLATLADLSRFRCVIPVLPGHGEGASELSARSAIELLRDIRERFQPTRALGFSLGAKLALLSGLNDLFLISLPAPQSFSNESREELLEAFQPRWVRESGPMKGLAEILGLAHSIEAKRIRAFHAQKDLASVLEASAAIPGAQMIPRSNHSLILQSPRIAREVEQWFTPA